MAGPGPHLCHVGRGGYRLLAAASAVLVTAGFGLLALLMLRRGVPPIRAFAWTAATYAVALGSVGIRRRASRTRASPWCSGCCWRTAGHRGCARDLAGDTGARAVGQPARVRAAGGRAGVSVRRIPRGEGIRPARVPGRARPPRLRGGCWHGRGVHAVRGQGDPGLCPLHREPGTHAHHRGVGEAEPAGPLLLGLLRADPGRGHRCRARVAPRRTAGSAPVRAGARAAGRGLYRGAQPAVVRLRREPAGRRHAGPGQRWPGARAQAGVPPGHGRCAGDTGCGQRGRARPDIQPAVPEQDPGPRHRRGRRPGGEEPGRPHPGRPVVGDGDAMAASGHHRPGRVRRPDGAVLRPRAQRLLRLRLRARAPVAARDTRLRHHRRLTRARSRARGRAGEPPRAGGSSTGTAPASSFSVRPAHERPGRAAAVVRVRGGGRRDDRLGHVPRDHHLRPARRHPDRPRLRQ